MKGIILAGSKELPSLAAYKGKHSQLSWRSVGAKSCGPSAFNMALILTHLCISNSVLLIFLCGNVVNTLPALPGAPQHSNAEADGGPIEGEEPFAVNGRSALASVSPLSAAQRARLQV